MPEITGTLTAPRQSVAPDSPTSGQLYFDTDDKILYYWNGTTWISTQSSSGTIYDSDQIGTVKSFVGTVIPTNWMLADGRTLNRVDYPQLADAMGVLAGATTFTLPDLRGKFIYGKNAPTDAITGGGTATETLSMAQMPSHSHRADGVGGTGGQTGAADRSLDHLHSNGQGGIYYSDAGSNWAWMRSDAAQFLFKAWTHTGAMDRSIDHLHGVNANGSGSSHNNLPPYILLAFIIKVTGTQIDSGGALIGATGPAGRDGVVQQAFRIGGMAVAPTWTASVWARLPLSGATSTRIDPAGAFTLNADHSVTIRDEGWYDVSATGQNQQGGATALLLQLCSGAAGATVFAEGSSEGPWSRPTVAGAVYCLAGERIAVQAWTNVGSPNVIACTSLSITRVGAGVPGPQGPAGPAGGALALIEEKILGVAGPISFLSIPQTYRHLWLIGSVKPTANSGQGIALRFNNDVGASTHYSQGLVITGAGTPGSEQWGVSSSQTYARCGATFLTAEYASLEVLIPNYRDVGANRRQFHSRCFVYNGVNFDQRTYAGRYNGSAAVTRIDLLGDVSSNFEPGTKLCLYGVL